MRSTSSNHGAVAEAMEAMVRGREGATRLRSLIMAWHPGDSAAEALVEEVRGSFAAAISALASGDGAAAEGGGQGGPGGSVCSGDRRSEVSTGKRKESPEVDNDRRRVCRRRSQTTSRREVMATSLNDGQTWRKYGQKDIQNCTQPKSYFRCTHKHDQRCMAARQVQRSEDDPSTFIITYLGEHTCRDPSTIPQFVETPLPKDSYLISFKSNNNNSSSDNNNNNAGTTAHIPRAEAAALPQQKPPSFKQECDEEVLSSLTPAGSSQAECSLLAGQLAAIVGGGGGGGGSEGPLAAPNEGDVTSELHYSSLDFIVPAGSFEMEDFLFDFDHDGFPPR